MLCGRCNFDLLDDVQFAVRSTTCSLPSGEATTTSSTALRSLRCLATAGQHKLLKKFDGYPDTPIDGTPEAYEEWLQGVEVRLKPCLCPSKGALYSSRQAARAACRRFAPDTGTVAEKLAVARRIDPDQHAGMRVDGPWRVTHHFQNRERASSRCHE